MADGTRHLSYAVPHMPGDLGGEERGMTNITSTASGRPSTLRDETHALLTLRTGANSPVYGATSPSRTATCLAAPPRESASTRPRRP